MHKIREVLRLRFEQDLSYRAISASCRIAVGTVHDYLARCAAAGLSFPLSSNMAPTRFPSTSAKGYFTASCQGHVVLFR
jgi:hypothetical protein